MDPYRAPWWLPGGNLQTLAGPLLERSPLVAWTRERWDTPDGDFIDVDGTGPADAPRLLVLFHGLEGDSRSHYARAIADRALSIGGWRCAVPHFRGCSGWLNRKPRAYHAGDSEEIDWILRRFARSHLAVYAVGVSLGGNALLKWLGERRNSAASVVRRAAAVSATIDLAAFGDSLATGFGRVYSWYFLNCTKLRCKALAMSERFPYEFAELGISVERIRAAKTLADFDDALTAPLHGFGDKERYWQLASALHLLPAIQVPTLLLNARNDPFLPEHALPGPGQVSDAVTPEFPQEGGHAGFPGMNHWLAHRVLDFMSEPAK